MKTKLRPTLWAALAALALVAAQAPAQERHRGERHAGPRWHGDIRSFRDHDVRIWRGGRWHHGVHDGHLGWWWVVAGVWYLYNAPIYPYPDPYRPPVVVVPSPAPPTAYWYYCTNPPGYYPYVPRCLAPWQPVPATGP